MSLYGSDRARARARFSPSAFAELGGRLALQSYTPRRGGLFGSGWAQYMADRAGAARSLVGASPPQAVQLRRAPAALGAISAQVPIAAPAPSRWPIPVPGCASCHGPRQPPAAPPSQPRPQPEDPWTYYPDISRRSGGGWGRSPERSGDEPKQCTMQDRRDGVICSQQRAPTPELTAKAKAVCQESRSKRYAHCLATREVGDPQLKTYKRWQGEPPIRRWKPRPKPRLR